MTNIRKRMEEIAVSLAMQGRFDGYIAPHLWEELRQRLQSIYRKATGEEFAVLTVEGSAAPAKGESET